MDTKDLFMLKDWLDKINNIGSEKWVTIYQSKFAEVEVIGLFSGIIPNTKVQELVKSKNPDWDIHIGDGKPGFVIHYNKDSPKPEYLRYGQTNGVEPLVIVRNFHELRPQVIRGYRRI